MFKTQYISLKPTNKCPHSTPQLIDPTNQQTNRLKRFILRHTTRQNMRLEKNIKRDSNSNRDPVYRLLRVYVIHFIIRVNPHRITGVSLLTGNQVQLMI